MADSLRELLAGLCRGPEDEEILAALDGAVDDFDAVAGLVVFESGMDFEFEEPGDDVPHHPDVPASFHAISNVVGALWWDAGGPEAGWALQEEGAPDADDWLIAELESDDPEQLAAIKASGPILPAFFAGQNGLFFDPSRSLANGEPALAFVSHEGGGWEPVESVDDLDYGQIFLRLLSDAMIDTEHVPEVYF